MSRQRVLGVHKPPLALTLAAQIEFSEQNIPQQKQYTTVFIVTHRAGPTQVLLHPSCTSLNHISTTSTGRNSTTATALNMAEFLTNLVTSIFTPGPTPSLVVATNASFAALQLVLLLLLIATYSVHFLILSVLSAGLWWAINWFVAEIQAGNAEEEKAKRLREIEKESDEKAAEDSGTETEAAEETGRSTGEKHRMEGGLRQESAEVVLRKRRSLAEASGDLSTDSEWDKVSNEGEEDA